MMSLQTLGETVRKTGVLVRVGDKQVVSRCCVGAAITGFPKWRFAIGDKDFRPATEYSHREGAVAHSWGLPLLTIADEGLEPRLLCNSIRPRKSSSCRWTPSPPG